MSWDFESGLGGCSHLGILLRFQSASHLAGAEEITFKMASSYGWKVASPRTKDPGNKGEGTMPFMT